MKRPKEFRNFYVRQAPEKPKHAKIQETTLGKYDLTTLQDIINWSQIWDVKPSDVEIRNDDSECMYFSLLRRETDEEFAKRMKEYERSLKTHNKWMKENEEKIKAFLTWQEQANKIEDENQIKYLEKMQRNLDKKIRNLKSKKEK